MPQGIGSRKLRPPGRVAQQAAGRQLGKRIDEQPFLRPDERLHRWFMSR
jgi:hypothetical protein